MDLWNLCTGVAIAIPSTPFALITSFRKRRYRRIHLFERRKALFPLVRDNGHGNVWMRHKVANNVRTPVTVSDNPYFHTEQISISEGGIPAFCAFRMSTVFFRVSRRFYPPSPHARTLFPFPRSTSYSPKKHARPGVVKDDVEDERSSKTGHNIKSSKIWAWLKSLS